MSSILKAEWNMDQKAKLVDFSVIAFEQNSHFDDDYLSVPTSASS